MSGQPFTFEEFEEQLTYVLQRLYDPSLHTPDVVNQLLGLVTQERLDVLQTAIIQTVEDLRPADYVPKTTRSWRMYSILYYRFVSNLPQEEVAERVYITARHLRREQTNAIHLLALKLWEKAHLPAPAEPDEAAEREESVPEGAPASQLPESSLEAAAREAAAREAGANEAGANPEKQLQADLLALQESAPGIISNVIQVVKSVLGLAGRIPAGEKLRVGAVEIPEELNAALHPSALRQVLWMILHHAINQLNSGEVSIRAGVAGKMAFIELTIAPTFPFDPQRTQTINEILDVQDGRLACQATAGGQVFRIELLNVDRKVLVVEDNPDIVHLYQRYLVGTQYYLIHQASGQDLFARIARIEPNVIVLDIMLPDVDGWDLLTRLLEHPDTRMIPVIVSSVVSDPELAMALGASMSLSKPVQRLEFIRALDQVSGQV